MRWVVVFVGVFLIVGAGMVSAIGMGGTCSGTMSRFDCGMGADCSYCDGGSVKYCYTQYPYNCCHYSNPGSCSVCGSNCYNGCQSPKTACCGSATVNTCDEIESKRACQWFGCLWEEGGGGDCSNTATSCGESAPCTNCAAEEGCDGDILWENADCYDGSCEWDIIDCSVPNPAGGCACECGDYFESEDREFGVYYCVDELDNDCDGLTDCDEPLCAALPACIDNCGDRKCMPEEYCLEDSIDCYPDPMCYEPVCEYGCVQKPVANGRTDESCFGSTGCAAGINCRCNGEGGCVSDCRLSNVVIDPDCGGDECEEGETVSITFTTDGNCAAGDHIQVDAFGDDCSITFTGGDMSGVWQRGIDFRAYQYRILIDSEDASDCWATQGGNAKCGDLFSSLSECESYDTCTIFEPPACRSIGKPSPKDWAEFDRKCQRVGGAPARQTVTWTVPAIPSECEGVPVSATNAAVWDGDPGTGTKISNTVSATGGFTFYGEPIYQSCNDYSGWYGKNKGHAYCRPESPVGCVHNSDPLVDDYYDLFCDTDRLAKPVGVVNKIGGN